MTQHTPPSTAQTNRREGLKPAVGCLLCLGLAVALSGCAGSSDSNTYVEKAQRPYGDLTSSATAISTRLATASTSKDLPKVAQAATTQLRLVSRAERQLRRIEVSDGERAAHTALTRALAKHRDFLTGVVRISKSSPETARTRLSGLRSSATRMVDAYRAFLAVAPEADGSITATGLIRNVGLFGEALRPPPQPAPAPRPAPPPPSGPGSYADFITPSGKNACRAEGGGIYCSSNTSYAVFLGNTGPYQAAGTTSPQSISGSTFGYGSRWSTPDGAITCFVQASGATGVYCQNSQGYGFRLWDGGLTSY